MVISQAFKLDIQEPQDNAKSAEKGATEDKTIMSARSTGAASKIFSFQRNEVIFDNRECILLNIRDLTDQEIVFTSKAKIDQLNHVIDLQTSEIKESLTEIKRKSG